MRLPSGIGRHTSVAMPRIHDGNLDGVAFLYRNTDEAESRERLGGSAFIVGRELKGGVEAFGHPVYLPYLVSNKHVVFNGSACVATVNKRDRTGTVIWDIDQNDWHAHPTDDIAVACVVNFHNGAEQAATFIQERRFVTPEFLTESKAGVGDEVFMVGRFVNHQGTTVNRPAVRFGSISMMQEVIPVRDESARILRYQESFAVEMRSRTGFSGAPVAIYRTVATVLVDVPYEHTDFWRLLGVNYGYVIDEKGENTWLNGVVPAWKITEVLNLPALRAIQDEHEANIAKQAAKGGVVTLSGLDAPPSDEEIAGRRDAAILRALNTKPSPKRKAVRPPR